MHFHWSEKYDYSLSHPCPRYTCAQFLKLMSVYLQWHHRKFESTIPMEKFTFLLFVGNEFVQSSLLKPRRAERYFKSQALDE